MASRAPFRLPRWLEQLLELVHVDWEPSSRQPAARRVVLATVLAVVGSLVVDAALVALGTRVFPSTRGFTHFRFGDYASLTTVGVLAACAGWPIVTRVTSRPRWLFSRLAVVVTLVLLMPDAWILLQGEQPEAVAVLVAMHLAIALVTYHFLVYLAPAGRRRAVTGAMTGRTGAAHAAGAGRRDGGAHWDGNDGDRGDGAPVASARPVVALAGAPGSGSGARARARVAMTTLPETDGMQGRVARPPASLAEPRSAVRVLPARPKSPRADEAPSG